jgi:hypothetical protein
MTEKEAIIILTYYNDWRMGAEIPMKQPKVITKAIETIINAYKKRKNK